MRLIAILPLLAALALGACAQRELDTSGRGDPARLLYAEQGTRITLSNVANGQASETVITAGRAQGPQGRLVRQDGTQGSFYPGCWGCGAPNTIDERAYAALWPLETGKQVSFLRTTPEGEQARIVIRVAGIQDVTTPAGTFETYLLDGRIENLTGARYSAQVRAWWAPGPGWVVKAEGGDSRASTLSSEVTAFSRP